VNNNNNNKKKPDKTDLKKKEREKEREERFKLEEKEERERVEIEKRLHRAEKELQKIGEKEVVEVVGIERIATEINKLRSQVDEITTKKERSTIYVFTALVVFLGILAIPEASMPGLSVMGQRAIAIFAFVFVLWITEVIPLPAAALVPGVLLYFLGIRPSPTEAFKTYAHPAVFFIIGSLIIAQGIIQSGLGKRFAFALLSKCRDNANLLLLFFITASAILAMFISDHLVAAMLLPVAIAVIVSAKIEGKFRIGLVFAIAFGCGIAGLATPSGGARNVITLGFLQEMAGVQLSYLEWMIAAVPITLIMIPLLWVVLRFLFPPINVDIKSGITELEKSIRPMGNRQWKTLGVFALTIALFVLTSDLIGLGTAAIIGAVLMFLVGALQWEEAEKSIAWGVMFIYGAALTMGIALKDTGAAAWLAQGALNILPHASPLMLLISVVVLSAIITNFISDGAAAAVLVPITINIALISELNPAIIAMATAIPCAFAFLTVFGSPRNTIVYSSGYFKSKDLFRAGLVVEIFAITVMVLIAKYYWTWLGMW